MSRKITIISKAPVSNLNELNRLIDAFVTVDEVYRVMTRPLLLEADERIDFRKKEYRDIEGASLGGFRINSPPIITITVDVNWIAALTFVLVNYKTVKENTAEILSDSKNFLAGIEGLTKNEIELIEAAIRMLAESIGGASERAVKGLLHKIQAARARINHKDIESIKVSDEDT